MTTYAFVSSHLEIRLKPNHLEEIQFGIAHFNLITLLLNYNPSFFLNYYLTLAIMYTKK